MTSDSISVFYASDNNYSIPLSVSMVSVVANTKEFVNFYILENCISQENKNKIESLKEKYSNFSVEWVSVDMNLFKNLPNINWYSLNMYSRFLIPEIKPNLSKVIYLDVDIILIDDIKKLYDIDLENNIIGAVHGEQSIVSTSSFKKHLQELNISDTHWYFGSGVLLIDCLKWKESDILTKLFAAMDKYKTNLKYPDQDALNIVFDSTYKVLDDKFNRDINCLKNEKLNLKSLNDELFLIHYDGPTKPWIYKDMFLSEFFWQYAKITPFYKFLCDKAKSIHDYRKNYYLFNIAPLFSCVKKGKRINVAFLKIVPLLKIKYSLSNTKFYLFGFIPLIKITKD